MKRKITTAFTIASLTIVFPSLGQNMVPNHSFEIQDTCPAVSEIWLAQPWNSANLGSPDLFNSTCSTQNSPGRTGIGSSGVYAYSVFPNNREYIQAQLTSPLVSGQNYCVSFYVKRTNFRYATNQFGAYFSNGEQNLNNTSNMNVTPQIQHNSANFITSESTWTQISGSFIAVGGENHIIIGNFKNDANSDTIVANSGNTSKVAYYRIDDISVTACNVGINEINEAGSELILYPTPASAQLTIKNNSNLAISGYSIIDLRGTVLNEISLFTLPNEDIEIDINELPEGMYIIIMDIAGGKVTKRFTVTK